MMGKRGAIAVALAAAAVALAGCTSQGVTVDETISVYDAKAIAQQIERDISALVPDELVSRVEQAPDGVLLSCDPNRGYQWTGSTTIILDEASDIPAIVRSVGDSFAEREGFTTRDISEEGDPAVQILGEYGSGYIVGPWADGTQIRIFSSSPCFKLPEDQWSGGTY